MKSVDVATEPALRQDTWEAHREQEACTLEQYASPIRTGNRSLVQTVAAFALPIVAPITLCVSTASWSEPITRAYVILGIITFLLLYPGRWSSSYGRASPTTHVLTPWLISFGVLVVIGYATQSFHFYSPEVIMTWAAITPLVQLAVLRALPTGLAALVRMRRDKHRVVIVGANDAGIAFARALNANAVVHSQVVAFFDDRGKGRIETAGIAPHAGSMADLAEYTRQARVDQIYIALPVSSQPRIVAQLNELRDCTASIYFVPDLLSMDLIQPRLDTHAGFAVVSVCESPFNGVDGLLKRSSDLLLASFALLVLTPLMVLIAMSIKFTSPGPILFRQRRFGLDSKEIMVWKFRTMNVVEDGATSYTQVVKGDSRLTSIGRFLRQSSLDELPQFFNVLQGKMSIVGPRPHALMVNDHFRRRIPGYMVRHKVRPGITGWAQIHGYRGGDDLHSMTKRIEYDLSYLRNWSIWLDLRILIKTVALVFNDSKAF